MTIYEIAWYFFIYAFLGWCTEVSFFAVKKGKFVNRGFLNGPVCPVYGFGLVAVIAALTPLKDNLLLLFLGSVLITSALEFLTGWALEKIFHTRWLRPCGDGYHNSQYAEKFACSYGNGCGDARNFRQNRRKHFRKGA